MSKDYNEWEAKSIESELDKIRAKYLMSPSDFDKSSSLKHMHINYTGTFKQDRSSMDTRNQSLDNYGNEIREFVIDHPFKNQHHSQSSHVPVSSFSKDNVSIQSREDKENFNSFPDPNIIIEKPEPKPRGGSKMEFYKPNHKIKIDSYSKQPTPKSYDQYDNHFQNNHRCTTKNTDRAKINIELDNGFYNPRNAQHQSVKHISEDRISGLNCRQSSMNSNIVVTEPRRDASYNSLLDMRETERRDTTDRGIDCTSSIKPYERKSYREDTVESRRRSRSHQRSYSGSCTQISPPSSKFIAPKQQSKKDFKDMDHDSSFENERKLYESGCNSK